MLLKCLRDRSQNGNEAFNAFVWNRCPKNIFVGKVILDILSVASAVVALNDGASGIIDIMSKVGLHAGFWNLESTRHTDFIRISGPNYLKVDGSSEETTKVSPCN